MDFQRLQAIFQIQVPMLSVRSRELWKEFKPRRITWRRKKKRKTIRVLQELPKAKLQRKAQAVVVRLPPFTMSMLRAPLIQVQRPERHLGASLKRSQHQDVI